MRTLAGKDFIRNTTKILIESAKGLFYKSPSLWLVKSDDRFFLLFCSIGCRYFLSSKSRSSVLEISQISSGAELMLYDLLSFFFPLSLLNPNGAFKSVLSFFNSSCKSRIACAIYLITGSSKICNFL